MQVLRRVRDALRDLVRDLVNRALALREQIYDLGPPAAAERLCHRRQRVEQCHLRCATCHILKLSLELLKIKRYAPQRTVLTRAERRRRCPRPSIRTRRSGRRATSLASQRACATA